MLASTKMKRAGNFKYFCSILEENGGNDKMINERGIQAGVFLRSVGNLVRNKDVPHKSK